MKRTSVYDYDDSLREVPLVRRYDVGQDSVREPSYVHRDDRFTTAAIGTFCFAIAFAILVGFALLGGAA